MGVKRRISRGNQKDLSIEDAFESFLEYKRGLNRSPATISSFEGSFKMWSNYIESSGLSTDISAVEVNSYVYAFRQHYLNEDMKATTLNHYLRDIRSFLYWCIDEGLIPNGFKVELVSEQEVIKETYSEDELALLIAKPSRNADFVEWRSWAIINWVLATGNRANTVCNIKLGDINYTKDEIYITKTKTLKAMIIPLSSSLKVVLKEYVRSWRGDATDDEYLFPSVGDEQLTVNALKHSIRRYNLNRGVEKTSIHALRHTFAKQWIRNTGDVFRLQKLLGHTTLEMTRHYVNMFSEDLKEGFDTYNPLDRIKKSSSRTQKIKRTDKD